MVPGNNSTDDTAIEYSVLIARVSTEDSGRILETLEALNRQRGDQVFETVIVDRLKDTVSERIRSEYPAVRLIECPEETDLPTMRTLAMQHSRGARVLVTEDHCIPPADWLEKISAVFACYPEAAVVGGAVENGLTETALDWATFLCEYAALSPPIETVPAANVAGMNVAYRRETLDSADEKLLTAGFWETTLHPVLRRQGQLLVADDEIRISHCKRFSFGFFLRQRFHYSMYYAGNRFAPDARLKRFLAAVATLALPMLLFVRLIRDTGHKANIKNHVMTAMPYLLLFYLAWAGGEIRGYLSGPADSLRRIE